MNQAEADLVRLKQEADELRAKLAANEQKQLELATYLKLLKVYGPEETQDNPVKKDTAAPTASVAKSPTKRSSYGMMVAIVNMCAEILKETRRPWRTVDLL